jgi:hypothetical protein
MARIKMKMEMVGIVVVLRNHGRGFWSTWAQALRLLRRNV